MRNSVNDQFIPAVTRNKKGVLTVTIRKEVPQNIGEIHRTPINWATITKAVRMLLQWRAEHCQEELAEHVTKGETFVTSPDSDYILYKDGGHFSVPVYEAMVEALNLPFESLHEALCFSSDIRSDEHSQDQLRKAGLLIQQALRQLFWISRNNAKEVAPATITRDLQKTQLEEIVDPMFLFNVLTELLLVH